MHHPTIFATFCVLTVTTSFAHAQPTTSDREAIVTAQHADEARLADFNERRLSATARGMQVLTGWALANMAVGVTGWAVAEDERWRSFHLMNAGWNVVNLGLGASGWWGAAKTDPSSLDLASSLQEVVGLENLLLFNAGLDVAYIVGGSALWWAGSERERQDWTGWGQSVVLQGAFLLGFDLVMWAVEKSFRDELIEDYWER